MRLRYVQNFLIFSSIFLMFGCDKIRAEKFEGIYQCFIESNSWISGGPNTDTSYFGDLDIERDGKELIISSNWYVNVDFISNEKKYSEGGGSNYISIQFKND